MSNDYVAPINHSAGSAAVTTVVGVAGGAVKGGIGGALAGFFAPILTGAVVLGGLGLLIAGGFTMGLVGPLALIGAGLGGVFAVPGAQIGTVIGGLFGGAKGATRASDQVGMERAAAVNQMQFAAYEGQASALAAQNKYNVPAHMNVAGSSIQTGNDNMQYDGRVAGAQLAAAR